MVNVLTDVISAPEQAAWRNLQRAQITIMRRLETELVGRHHLPLASFEVLQRLEHAPGHRLRMNDLAGQVLLSRSGLTRLIDRMEREGLVERHACRSDARGLYAVLTEPGQQRLAGATPTYERCIRECFLGRIGTEDLRHVAVTASKLVSDLG